MLGTENETSELGGDTGTLDTGVGADTVANETQPTGSEVTEQPSQIGNEAIGADTGTDTDLGLESLLGTQNETSELVVILVR